MNFHFQSEEAHARDNRLKFLSGFSGSYGFAVVTSNKAAIWVTGLDELQADLELSCDWLLMKSGHPGVSVFLGEMVNKFLSLAVPVIKRTIYPSIKIVIINVYNNITGMKQTW